MAEVISGTRRITSEGPFQPQDAFARAVCGCGWSWYAERRSGDVIERADAAAHEHLAESPDCGTHGGPSLELVWTVQLPVTARLKPPLTEREMRAVLRRDPCAYCSRSSEHLDHIIARSRGGCDQHENRAGACARCNVSKGGRPLLSFLAARKGVAL